MSSDVISKEKMKKTLTIIFLIINLSILPIALMYMLMSPMSFDAPGSQNNPIARFFFISCWVYPVIVIVSLVLTRKFYKKQRFEYSLLLSVGPLILLAIITITMIILISLIPEAPSYRKSHGQITFYGELIKGADQKSFIAINAQYAKDSNNVYYNGRILEEADPDTFEIVGSAGAFGTYTKDKNYVWLGERKLEDADPSTFQFYKNSNYAKDINFVYHAGCKVKGADASSFEAITGNNIPHYYGKDKNYVYIGGKILEGVNPDTFVPPTLDELMKK